MKRSIVAMVLSVTTAFLAVGCMWGTVTDANTGAPISGATVTYTDGQGHTAETTTDANGGYSFDHGSGPVPAHGPISFTLSAPGYQTVTVPRLVEYNDNPNASLSNLSSFWEVQDFNLVSPLVGMWREDVQFACGTGEEVIAEHRVEELLFRPDGTFAVTWTPFEVYVDYWGEYTYNAAEGTLDLTVGGGNYVPTDLDGSGTFSIDPQGRLILTDIWLGSYRDEPASANCGHRFTFVIPLD